MWIPPIAQKSQARLSAIVHIQDASHRGVNATIHHLGLYCSGDSNEAGGAEFVQQYLHCADHRVGDVVPCPLDDVVHGTYHCTSSISALERVTLSIEMDGLAGGGHGHLLVLMEDARQFVWLEEMVPCSSEVAMRTILKWLVSFGVPKAFASNDGTYFKRGIMEMVKARLGVVHFFSVGNLSWSDGTLERIENEVVRTFWAAHNEERLLVSEWPLVIGVVQWPSIQRFGERPGRIPFAMMTGRPPLKAVLEENVQEWVDGWEHG